ncbi:SGNH/GDSL hydrolase family protein [Iodobacter fluviatilis]|jgi:thermolabile hemolysin|uniref:Thermolabile hemolysin n=1 Tax=Iodobacter fluviatilis TaxID=537 RepID=A0A7G3GET9_9NEIS|nr:SGNH/GDSL hydrolase family protein [Iodobacter fluviatilis]QBC45463.1 thermolabile hemolysin [Iodobacter fluviatilis]
MRHLILISLLIATAAVFANENVSPDVQLGSVLSAEKPLSAEELFNAPKVARSARLGGYTYTYLRCYYRKKDELSQPATTYAWATDPSSGAYYKLYGNWWADGLFQWKNMFYSEVAQETLSSVCRQTLSQKGIKTPVALVAAANNALSFDSTVWTNDQATQSHAINKVIAFGDSLSDTQNMYNASFWKLPNSKTWFIGSFSNDKVWVEYFAENLKLPLYNWAIGGSAADTHLVVPGLIQQVQSWKEYTSQAPAYHPESTLFTMLIGGNDLISYGRSVDQLITAQTTALDTLIAAGASNILLLNLPNVSRAPIFKLRNDADNVAAQVIEYNQRLTILLKALRDKHGARLNIQLFDTNAMFADLLDHPSKYNVKNTTQACLNINSAASTVYLQTQKLRLECTNPDEYVFWDNMHPTTHTHLLLGQFTSDFAKQYFVNLPVN